MWPQERAELGQGGGRLPRSVQSPALCEAAPRWGTWGRLPRTVTHLGAESGDWGVLLVRTEPQGACGTADPGQHREAPKATDLYPRQGAGKEIWQLKES